MNTIIDLVSVIAIFAVGFIILFFFLWVVNRKRLFNLWGILTASFGAGFGFGCTAFLATFLDEKSITWNLVQRLRVGLEIFLWFFVGSLILIPIVIAMTKARKGKIL